jgi:hypothetical protein
MTPGGLTPFAASAITFLRQTLDALVVLADVLAQLRFQPAAAATPFAALGSTHRLFADSCRRFEVHDPSASRVGSPEQLGQQHLDLAAALNRWVMVPGGREPCDEIIANNKRDRGFAKSLAFCGSYPSQGGNIPGTQCRLTQTICAPPQDLQHAARFIIYALRKCGWYQ